MYYYTCLFLCSTVFFFFFKQKTAYEMRISDWSSDVCSSDLPEVHRETQRGQNQHQHGRSHTGIGVRQLGRTQCHRSSRSGTVLLAPHWHNSLRSCRGSVVPASQKQTPGVRSSLQVVHLEDSGLATLELTQQGERVEIGRAHV